MKEHLILFSGPMVRAILDGRKTQTRRVVKGIPSDAEDVFWWTPEGGVARPGWADPGVYYRTPRGLNCIRPPWRVGDKLWVRETWQTKPTQYCVCPQPSEPSPCDAYTRGIGCQSGERQVAYAASGDKAPCWRPSIHMPRWASRITLEVTGVRAERLREISEEDAKAEGAESASDPRDRVVYDSGGNASYCPVSSYVFGFEYLWDSLNAARGYGWDANPWVWVIEFKREVAR